MSRTVLLAVVLCASAASQTFHGSIRGQIADPNGAAVNAARFALVNDATSATRTTVTNDAGEYVFSSVVPAT